MKGYGKTGHSQAGRPGEWDTGSGQRYCEQSAVIDSQVGNLEVMPMKKGMRKTCCIFMFIVEMVEWFLLQGLWGITALVYMKKLCPEAGLVSDIDIMFLS